MKNRLKEIRQEKKLTLKEVSSQLEQNNLKISPDALAKYERGDREPKLETWQKLADFFHVPTEYLMGLTNDRVTLTINDLNPAEEDAYKHITAMLSEDYPKGSISKNKIGRLLADEGLWEETMKEITVDQTKKIVFDYVRKLAKQHKLDPKKDIFNVVLPLENNQAISCYVGPNEDGERAVEYTFYGQNYIMPKLKNTVLDLLNDK